jgi:hypothetical protein
MTSFNTSSVSAPKKCVAFAEYSTLIVTRGKTEEELKSVWYSKSEMKAFRVKAGRSADDFEGKSHCC